MDNRLRYRIDSWKRLPECLSNISRDLHISVTDMIQNSRLCGTRISIEHDEYGVLFSCMTNAWGTLIDSEVDELPPSVILNELARYGFLIEFSSKVDISITQLVCLRGAYDLGFDKVRLLSVWHYESNGAKAADNYVVAFHSDYNQDWLNNGYSCSDSEFNTAIKNGQAMNLSTISVNKSHSWPWLYGYVLNIKDILSIHSDKLYKVDRRSITVSESD